MGKYKDCENQELKRKALRRLKKTFLALESWERETLESTRRY